MKSRRLLATTMAGGAAAALTLVLLRRRLGPLRLDRGRAALRLFVRGGVRYAASDGLIGGTLSCSRARVRRTAGDRPSST